MAKPDINDQASKLEKLIAFRGKDKFSDEAWEERGLNPSPKELSNSLQEMLNECANSLIYSIKENEGESVLTSWISVYLDRIDEMFLDTEENEFAVDLMFELSQIVNVDIKSIIYDGMPVAPNTAISEVIHKCTKCGEEIKLVIVRKDPDVPDYSYDVLECVKCGELYLFDNGPGIKEYGYENATIIKHLYKKKFTKEQAFAKMMEWKGTQTQQQTPQKSMSVVFVQSLSIEVEKTFGFVNSVSDSFEEYFENRHYGDDLNDLLIMLICVAPRFEQFFKPEKPKYKKCKEVRSQHGTLLEPPANRLSYDIKLDFAQYNKADDVKKLLGKDLLDSLEIIPAIKRIKDFDLDRFRGDLKELLEKIEWL